MIIQTLQIRFFPYKVPRMAKIAVFSHQENTVRDQYINYEDKRIPTLHYRLTTETKTNKISHFYQSSTYHSTRVTREIGSLFSLPNKNNICNGRKHIEILGKTLIHFWKTQPSFGVNAYFFWSKYRLFEVKHRLFPIPKPGFPGQRSRKFRDILPYMGKKTKRDS